jgi:hypothetical protein
MQGGSIAESVEMNVFIFISIRLKDAHDVCVRCTCVMFL